jgi:predicted transport protein
MPVWACPRCGRIFNRANVRHACGTGDRAQMLEGKPAALVALYERLEREVRAWGEIEVVAKPRYALLRTTRVFADVVFMKHALRLALQLDRRFDDPLFFKTVTDDRGRVQQVAKLHDDEELDRMLPHLRHAYRYSLGSTT